MMMRSGWRRTVCLGLGWVGATLALSVAYGEEPSTDTSAPPADAAPAGGHPPISTHFPHGRRIPYTTDAILDQRVKLLTAEIGLDEHQQTEVRALLVRQGAAIRRVWTDKSLTDGERGPITGAIGEKTADAIRDLLKIGRAHV